MKEITICISLHIALRILTEVVRENCARYSIVHDNRLQNNSKDVAFTFRNRSNI